MIIQRSEIYFVNLNPVQGREQDGQRPVLVLSTNAINRLPLETVFLGFQVRSLDASRFPDQPAGKLSDEKMVEVENAVRYCLRL